MGDRVDSMEAEVLKMCPKVVKPDTSQLGFLSKQCEKLAKKVEKAHGQAAEAVEKAKAASHGSKTAANAAMNPLLSPAISAEGLQKFHGHLKQPENLADKSD